MTFVEACELLTEILVGKKKETLLEKKKRTKKIKPNLKPKRKYTRKKK
jgi:hypothetical protein|tara:strand:+ start:1127 stop:1270 length:144 start_codon:yes stop_codon:yes gene_type:complete